MSYNNNNFKKLFFNITIFGALSFFVFHQAQSASPDAIGIRVIPNPSHLSALDWYNSNNFKGSPQSLAIDGYMAIRDGRTVYVNAANSIDNTLHTNMYILSYTQEAETGTVDIFSRILNNWSFNNNLSGLLGHCRDNISITCLKDAECPIRDFCDSKKARIVRDTRRLEDFAVVKNALNRYKEINGFFPKLNAGSYLVNKSVSTWPSWEDAFSDELGIKVPKDPVNKLGPCGDSRFSAETCWDEVAKQFYDLTPADFNLPSNSLAYVYNGRNNGIGYDFCGVMESGSVLPADSCSDAGMCLVGSGVVEMNKDAENHAPQFLAYNFPVSYAYEPYTAYLQAVDPDGDDLTWSMTGAWFGWTGIPRLEDIGVRGQKRLSSTRAGAAGRYNFSVTINDGRVAVTKNFYIIITAP